MVGSSFIIQSIIGIYGFVLRSYNESYLSYLLEEMVEWLKSSAQSSYMVLGYDSFKESHSKSDKESKFLSFKDKLGRGVRERLKPFIESSQIITALLRVKAELYMTMVMLVLAPLIPTAIIVITSFATIALLKCRQIVEGKSIVYSRPYALFYCLFLLAITMGLFFNLNTVGGIGSFIIYMSSIYLGLMIPHIVSKRNDIYMIVKGMTLVLGLLSLYGLYQKLVGVAVDPAWMDERFGDDIVRIYSVFGNPNVYGEYLILTIPIAITAFVIEKKSQIKLVFGAIALLGIANLFWTLSRASMIGIAIAILIIVVLKQRKLIPLLIIGLMVSPLILPDYIVERAMSTVGMSSQSEEPIELAEESASEVDSSISYRGSIYSSSMEILKDYPVTGVGIGQFGEVYKSYGVAKSYHPHNTFLMVAIETGILGISSLLLLGLTWAKNMLASIKYKADKLSFLNISLLGGIVGCSVQGLADHIWHNYNILFLFFIMLGIGYSSLNILKEEEVDEF